MDNSSSKPLISELIDDPIVVKLLPNYVVRIQETIEAMEILFQEKKFDQLIDLSHSARGSLSQYGYPSFASLLKKIELTLKENNFASENEIRPLLEKAKAFSAQIKLGINRLK